VALARAGAGTQFDQRVVDAFAGVMDGHSRLPV